MDYSSIYLSDIGAEDPFKNIDLDAPLGHIDITTPKISLFEPVHDWFMEEWANKMQDNNVNAVYCSNRVQVNFENSAKMNGESSLDKRETAISAEKPWVEQDFKVEKDGLKKPVGIPDKKPITKSLLERPDVVNRGILRGIKKYYIHLLNKHCPEYKTKRLWRVETSKLISNLESFLLSDPRRNSKFSLAQFVFCLLRSKDISIISESGDLEQQWKNFFDCINKYSHAKLEAIFGSEFTKELVLFITEDPERQSEFFEINPLMNRNLKAYEEGMARFTKGVLSKLLASPSITSKSNIRKTTFSPMGSAM